MNEDRWHTLQELFHAALQRAPEDRDAFLDERCGADIALRHEIGLLLAREGSDQGFVDSPPPDLARELLSVAERASRDHHRPLRNHLDARRRRDGRGLPSP